MPMNSLLKLFAYLLALIVIVIASIFGLAYHWATEKFVLQTAYVDLLVPSGSNPAGIARIMNQAGIELEPSLFSWLARLSQLDKKIKAGGYQIRQGDTPWTVLQRMAQGDVSSRQITLIEGWTLKQILTALDAQPDLAHLLKGDRHEQIVQAIGIQHPYAEGLFFPDTYIYFAGTSDAELLARAYKAQQQILDRAWESRDADLPLRSPYEALILASIIEKETGSASDRARIASVFVNRLKAGMPLQTDPTVIYGLGDSYDGKIRKKDLQTDTPWNTYTRTGLPPSPIASVGRGALYASLHPEKSNYLYFVARGDGSSAFASTLSDHNRNVAAYILSRKP